MKIAAIATFVAAVSASAAKIYWVVRPGNTRVYAVGDYEDSCERARTNDNAKHVFFDGGNDNPTKAWFEDPNNGGRYLNFFPDGNGGYTLYEADKDRNTINDNTIGNCWKTGLDDCDLWEDIYRASGWGQCNYS